MQTLISFSHLYFVLIWCAHANFSFYAWHSTKPKVNHLRVFGSDAYALIPKDEREKFDSKTRKCIIMGYGTVTKGYRLYNVTERKVMHNRNVQFNERIKDREHDSQDATNDYRPVAEFSEVSDIKTEHYTTQSEDNQSNSGELRRSTRQRSGYSDSAQNISDRMSTSGYIFMLSGGAISWSNRKQECVALPQRRMNIALSAAVQECIWLRQLSVIFQEQT